jgi:TRAP-type C4-dicarboxylate transport system substrate-binding protein
MDKKQLIVKGKNMAVILLTVAAVIGGGIVSIADAIEWKAVSYMQTTSDKGEMYNELLKEIGKRSKGALTINYVGGPEVIPQKEQGVAVRKGVVQMSANGASQIKGLVPEAGLLALARISPAEERANGASEYLRGYYAKAGLYYLGRLDTQVQQNFPLYLQKPVSTIDDLKNKKLAANGPYVAAMAKATGMSFMVLKTSDAYSGMSRGLIDAYSTSFTTASSFSIHEVAKYVLDHPFYRNNTSIFISLDAWNKLPKDLQKIVTDVYIEFEPRFAASGDEATEKSRELFKKAGVPFLKFSDQEAEKFYDIVYEAEAAAKLKEMPNSAEKYLKMVKAIK